MITKAAGTDEGRGQERVSTEPTNPGKRRWIYPLLIALPFLAVIALALIRFGTPLLNIINVLIKAAVVS